MDSKKIVTAIMAATIATVAIGSVGAAHAQTKDVPTDEAAVLANAKITMAQAITTAEREIGGKTVGSGIEDQDGTVFFEVSVLKDGARHKVLVDTQSGKVVKTVTADNEKNENGAENDAEDGQQ